jgi:hypothetical protein
MAEKITVIALDYDGTFDTHAGEKRDGYVETDEGIHTISTNVVFPQSPAVPVATLAELETMSRPPAYRGDAERAVVTIANDYLPLENDAAAGNRIERTRRDAIQLKQTRRQTVIKETGEHSRRRRNAEQAFMILAIGVAAATVLAVLATVALRYVQ